MTLGSNDRSKEVEPIIILGSPRTGTSILTAGLIKGAGISGHIEGHFLTMLMHLLHGIDEHYEITEKGLLENKDVLIANVDKGKMKKELIEWFAKQYVSLYPNLQMWVDKTANVSSMRLLPRFIQMFPRAKIIVTRRRPLEMLVSRLKKFPEINFEKQCKSVSSIYKAWLRYKKDKILNDDQFLEVEQRDIALKPEKVARDLRQFINLSGNQENNILEIFKKERPEFSGGNEKDPISLMDLNWTNEQIETFKKICGEIMISYGYSYDSSYYLKN